MKTFLDKSLPKSALSELLKFCKMFMPHPNSLPSSYHQVKSLISNELIQLETIHVCVNDCMLFRDENANADHCVQCGEGRYKACDILERRYGRRYFAYVSVEQSLENYFGCFNIAQIVQPAGSRTLNVNGQIIKDVVETEIWSDWTSPDPDEGETKVIIGLNTDRVNPYHSQGIQYSLWPIILIVMNLPHNIRNKEHTFWVVGVVPSKNPKETGENWLEPNLDPYLHLLADELPKISSHKLYSAYNKAPITAKCKLHIFMMDFQGYASV